jgi:Ni/Co efflux regulator RcnB
MTMRKLITLGILAATAIPTLAQARSGELRHDRREVREEQRDVNRAIRNGDSPREVREQIRDVREARREYRDDWRDYRERNRDVYRRPAYVGPRGYAYRPVTIGYRFAPTYYGRNYWVSDWQRYRLPAPGRFQQWVRYGNDVVLVNTRTGRVIAVNNRFFW